MTQKKPKHRKIIIIKKKICPLEQAFNIKLYMFMMFGITCGRKLYMEGIFQENSDLFFVFITLLRLTTLEM